MLSRREFIGATAAALPFAWLPPERPLALFRMNDCDIVAAHSFDQACAYYRQLSGDDLGWDPVDEYAHEIVGEELATLTRIDTDAPPPWDAYKNPRRRTAAEALADDVAEGCRAPYLFSSTEW